VDLLEVVGHILVRSFSLNTMFCAFEMAFAGRVLPFCGTPTITIVKLNLKIYLSWSASVGMCFLGQGYHDHLEKEARAIPIENKSQW